MVNTMATTPINVITAVTAIEQGLIAIRRFRPKTVILA
jgi:hypothetical protein